METLNLNKIPSGSNPVVHCSQYDIGRTFRFNLFEGSEVVTLDGTEVIECNVRKLDGNIVTVAVTNTSDSYVDVVTTEQMTAVHGTNYGEIVFKKGSDVIGTVNFILQVEKSPLEGGIESESEIHNLESMVDGMVAEEVATQYDSENVIFDNAPTSGHGTPYTVTSEGIKTAIDNAFDYDNTASGSLVHIEDGADNIPVKSLVSEIVAVESGNGQPKSPTNPYTISGFDSGIVTRCGKNLFDGSKVTTTNTSNWGVSYDSSTNILTIEHKTTYGSGMPKFDIPSFVGDLVISGNFGATIDLYMNGSWVRSMPSGVSFTCTSGNKYSLLFPNNSQSTLTYKVQLEIGDTSSEFEQYNGNTYTFAFGQTVYGGRFDNKGNLVVTHKMLDLGSVSYTYSSGDKWFYNASAISNEVLRPDTNDDIADIISEMYPAYSRNTLSGDNTLEGVAVNRTGTLQIRNLSYTDPALFKTAMSGVKLVYALATPITLAITSQDIPTLLGENNIFSNCGDLEVNYYTSKSNDILEFVDSEIGKKNGTNIPIEANSQDSIKDYVDDEISSTKDYVDNGLNDKVAYKSGEVVYSNYVTGAYISGSGNYVEFCIPINTNATSGTITNLGTTLNVFIGSTRLTNEVTLLDSSVVAIKDGYAQIELKLNSTQTANSVATVSLDGFTVNFT